MSNSQIKSLLDSSGRLHMPYLAHLRDRIDAPETTAADRDSASRALQFFAAPPESFEEMMTRRLGRVRESKVMPIAPEAPHQTGGRFSSETRQATMAKLRAIISDPNSTDEDTRNARKALLFFGETEETPPR